MESIKAWLLQVGIKKLGPSLLKGAIVSLMAYLAAHAGILESWGITSGIWPLGWTPGHEPSGHVILIELDTISVEKIMVVVGAGMAALTAAQHHSVAAIKGEPQSADPNLEARRATDPPKVEDHI